MYNLYEDSFLFLKNRTPEAPNLVHQPQRIQTTLYLAQAGTGSNISAENDEA